MVRKTSSKSPDDYPQEGDSQDRPDKKTSPEDDLSFYVSDDEDIEEIWKSSSSRSRRNRKSEAAEDQTAGNVSVPEESALDESADSAPAYRSRARRAAEDDGFSPSDRYSRNSDDESSEYPSDDSPQEGYVGRQRETIWNRNPYGDRNRSDYSGGRSFRQGDDDRRYRGGYSSRSEQDGGDAADDQNDYRDDSQDGGPSPDYRQGGYRQGGYQRGYQQGGHQQGGYQRGYQQGGYQRGYQRGYQQGGYQRGYQRGYQQGGYQRGYQQGGYQQDGFQQEGYPNNRFRQERFYRRHYRDTDMRVLRDSDIRGGEESVNTGGENQPAAENLQQNQGYQPNRVYHQPYYGRRYTNPGYPNELLDQMEPEHAPRGKYGEPLSLAEELASERYHAKEGEEAGEPAETFTAEEIAALDTPEMSGADFIASLRELDAQQLVKEARNYSADDEIAKKKREAVFRVLKEKIKESGLMYGEGTLEILPEEFGFLRNPEFHYLSCPDDIYISPSQIRRFGLRNGSTVFGQIRPPKEKERYFALLRIESINDDDPNLLLNKPMYDDLTAMHPNQRIILETPDEDMNTRVVDLIVPVGFGQRGLIVSPPRAGKTILMQKMARSVLTNYPNAYVFMLLVDERPEEVTDMERQVKGPHCEVISSTFDEPASRHIQVSEMVLDKAKRMVEYGKDVVIFLDSITRLARAWNSESPTSGKTLSGGVDAGALQPPKKFFGSARKVEEGGSLTIIATALVDTGSRMDEVIFEEFKGTGNLEVWLDRSLVDKRIWPAIDISRSGTRREEMILDPEEYKRMTVLRRILNEMNPPDAMEFLTQKLAKTQNNAEFLMSLNLSQY